MTIEPALAEWLLEQIRSGAGTVLGKGYQASARLLSGPDGNFVIKTAHNGWLGGPARSALRREAKIYARLQGIDGIPVCHGLVDDRHLVLEHIGGGSLRQRQFELSDREQFFQALRQTVEQIHEAGIAHGDLKRKDNTLLDAAEQPFLIDFGVAAVVDEATGWLGKGWFRWVCQMDRNAWIKLKYGRRPVAMTPEDAAIYRPLLLERVARWIRIPWQFLTLRRWRQRLARRLSGR